MATPPLLEPVALTNETSLKDVILSIKKTVSYLLSKWFWILGFALAGALGGYLYSYFSKPVFVAECTFVLDENTSTSNLGGLAALGLGGGGGSDGGLFGATDNIIWLYSTNLMLQKALLAEVERGGKKILLVDWLLKIEPKLKKNLDKNTNLKNIKFERGVSDSSLSIGQNTILMQCANMIRAKYLRVGTAPKTENIITVTVRSGDELFAKAFANEIIKDVNDFYVDSKTKKSVLEVALLEQKAGEYYGQMNSDMYQAASALDNEPYANPNRQVLRVAPQRKSVDVGVSSSIYTEIVKQLEISRTKLKKETPLIQVIEKPELPLKVEQRNPVITISAGIIAMVVLSISTLLVRYKFKSIMA